MTEMFWWYKGDPTQYKAGAFNMADWCMLLLLLISFWMQNTSDYKVNAVCTQIISKVQFFSKSL